MTDNEIVHNLTETIDSALFEIGGDDQLAKVRNEVRRLSDQTEQEAAFRGEEKWSKFLKETQIKIGTLLAIHFDGNEMLV